MTWAVLWYACKAVIIFIDFSIRSMRWIFIHVLDVKSYGCMDNVCGAAHSEVLMLFLAHCEAPNNISWQI